MTLTGVFVWLTAYSLASGLWHTDTDYSSLYCFSPLGIETIKFQMLMQL